MMLHRRGALTAARGRVAELALVVVTALAACASQQMQTQEIPGSTFSVRPNVWPDGTFYRGEPGPLHPAVIEYVLSAPESPLVAYFEVVLAQPQPPAVIARELHRIRYQLGGGLDADHVITARDYARAVARELAPYLIEALVSPSLHRTAGIMTAFAVDPSHCSLAERGFLAINDFIAIARRDSGRLVILSAPFLAEPLIWDLSRIPGAFHERGELTYEQVAALIRPLHRPTAISGSLCR